MALGLVKIVHFLAWVMLVASSIQKNRLISAQALDESAVMQLRRWDKVSGAMAGLMLLSGLGLLLWWAKPTSCYLNSEYFAVKMAFFSRQPLDCAAQNLDAPRFAPCAVAANPTSRGLAWTAL